MLKTIWAIVREGRLELLEKVNVPEGSRVLVTLLPEENENRFWLGATERSLASIWENTEDDIYARLLEK